MVTQMTGMMIVNM